MKHIFLIAGVAVLAFAVFKHHKTAPALGMQSGAGASVPVGGTDITDSPDLNDLSTATPPLVPVAISPLAVAPIAPAGAGRKTNEAISPGVSAASFFHPLEL